MGLVQQELTQTDLRAIGITCSNGAALLNLRSRAGVTEYLRFEPGMSPRDRVDCVYTPMAVGTLVNPAS